MKTLLAELRTSILATIALLLAVSGAYPLAVWALAHGLFPAQADGSLVRDASGVVRGSWLIGQAFSSDRYFWPRPSAAGSGYDATQSGGTNYGPTSATLDHNIAAAIAAYRRANGLPAGVPVPADAVTSSASGLDPDISLRNAELQAPRVARARGLPVDRVRELVATSLEGRDWGVFGEPRVNVLRLNLALDRESGH